MVHKVQNTKHFSSIVQWQQTTNSLILGITLHWYQAAAIGYYFGWALVITIEVYQSALVEKSINWMVVKWCCLLDVFQIPFYFVAWLYVNFFSWYCFNPPSHVRRGALWIGFIVLSIDPIHTLLRIMCLAQYNNLSNGFSIKSERFDGVFFVYIELIMRVHFAWIGNAMKITTSRNGVQKNQHHLRHIIKIKFSSQVEQLHHVGCSRCVPPKIAKKSASRVTI